MGSIFGYEVDSELPLERLRAADGPRGTIAVSRGEPGIIDEHAEITAIDSLETGATHHVFVIGRAGGRRMIGCSATGAFRLDSDRLEIEAHPHGTAEMWEHRLLSVIIPIMLAGREDLVLHSCVVEIDGKAVILCGPPMRGKSTLALTFSRLGHRVLSEDGAVLERRGGNWIVWPAASGVRIRADAGSGTVTKVLTTLPGPGAIPLPPGGVVLLEPRGGDGLPRPADAVAALLDLGPHLMHAGGVEAFRSVFGRLAKLLGDVPVVRVSMPDDLELLPQAATSLASSCLGLDPSSFPA